MVLNKSLTIIYIYKYLPEVHIIGEQRFSFSHAPEFERDDYVPELPILSSYGTWPYRKVPHSCSYQSIYIYMTGACALAIFHSNMVPTSLGLTSVLT
jgi:hypothetical protein